MKRLLRFDRRLLAYGHDIVIAALAFVVSLYLRLGDGIWRYWEESGDVLSLGLVLFVAIAAVSFRTFGMNSGIWRYASLRDLTAIVRAVTVTILVFLLLMFQVTRLEALPRSLPMIMWFVLVVLLSGPRLLYRLFKDRRLTAILDAQTGTRSPVLLIGAGDGAELFIRALASDRSAHFRAVGVIDDKGGRVGREIHGVKVMGVVDELEAVVAQLEQQGNRPERLILTKMRERLDGRQVRHLADLAESLNLSLQRLPALTEFRDDLTGMPALQPVALEDLLGRPQVSLDKRIVGDLIGGHTVLITGAGGSIGSELTRQIAGFGPGRLILVDNGEFNLYTIEMEVRERFPDLTVVPVLGDVRDRRRMLALFAAECPRAVFHAAALKHVPMVEYNPLEGILTNAIGTRNVADAASRSGAAAFVLISTDKAIKPSSVMGATKRIAECYCQAQDLRQDEAGRTVTRFITVRFGNVLGSTGSVVPLFERQLRAGGPLTVTHPDMRRYFMTVREAVELVLQASAQGLHRHDQRGKILVLDMGEPIRIADLARQMIRLAGLRPDKDVRIEFTGLRPGEKLFEELFDPAEPPETTDVDGVMMASPRAVDGAILARALEELENAARSGDEPRVFALLHHIVPEFNPPASAALARRD
ncbi:MAG: nucleoside-diphosphate sugar epimerase/dehydratase [Azospirillaceae bacterium]|nr:nucleoside-diphosphate sugar epimerase/dehydratase [Azospirillaceae bacterium]